MNNQTSITQEQKQYIIFNLKRFFEYYKLEENIIKANEDNKMINKMKGEVDNLLNFIPERLRTKLLNNIHHSSKHKEVIKSEDIAYRRIPNSKNNINQIKKTIIQNKQRNLTSDNIKKRNIDKKIIKNKTPIISPNKNKNYRDSYLNKIHHNINKSEDLNGNQNKTSSNNRNIRGTTPISSRNKGYLNDINKEKSVDNIIKKPKNYGIKNKVEELKRPLTPDHVIKKKNVNKNQNINHITQVNKIKPINKNQNKLNSNIKNHNNKFNNRESPLNKNKRNVKTTNNSKKQKNDKSLSKDKNKIIIKPQNQKIIIKPKSNINNINIKKDYYIIPNINFSQKNIIPLYYTIHLGYFEIEKKIKLILNQNELYKHYSSQNLFKEYYLHIEKEFTEISQLLLKYDMNKICIPFSPNKTAKNGLMFISKEDEKNLIENEQPEEIIIIFKVVLLLLEEDISKIENNKILQYLFIDIFQKYKVENIQNLFLNHIINKVHLLGKKYINDINVIIGNKPELLTPAEVLKYNRNVSYMTFIIKDIYNFLLEKTDDGIFFYELREFNKQLIVLNKKLERLKKFL